MNQNPATGTTMAQRTRGEPGLLSSFRQTWMILDRRRRIWVGVIFATMVVTSALEVVNVGLILPFMQFLTNDTANTPKFLDDILTAVLGTRNRGEMVAPLAGILLSVFIIKNLILIALVYYQGRLAYGLRADMTTRLISAYAHKSYEEHLRMNSAHAVYDISITGPSAVYGVLQSTMAIAMEGMLALGAVSALMMLAPKPAIVSGVMVGVALWAFYRCVRAALVRMTQQRQDLSRATNRWLHFTLGAARENMVLGRSGHFVRNVDDRVQRNAVLSTYLNVIGQMPRIYGEIVVVVSMICAALVIVDDVGSFEAALPILGVFAVAAFRVFPSANRIAHQAGNQKQAAVLLDEVFDDLFRSTEVVVSTVAEGRRMDVASEIKLKGIYYRYPRTSQWALRDIDMVLEKGKAVAIAGPTGAGKSTLVDVLLGLLPAEQGKILVDGRERPPSTMGWAGSVGYVPQEVYLLDDTVRRNVALGIADDEIDESRIWEVLEAAQVDDVVKAMDAGLDTVIGERGARISGGQRQRLGIARALYSSPDILVLDEATSALDTDTESAVTESIRNLRGRITLVVIAHRLQTIRSCDVIYYLRDGQIADSGTFGMLAERHEYFRIDQSNRDNEGKET